MATSEISPDCGTSGKDEQRSERELRWRAEEIVRESFRISPQYTQLVEQTMLALKQIQEDVDRQIAEVG